MFSVDSVLNILHLHALIIVLIMENVTRKKEFAIVTIFMEEWIVLCHRVQTLVETPQTKLMLGDTAPKLLRMELAPIPV